MRHYKTLCFSEKMRDECVFLVSSDLQLQASVKACFPSFVLRNLN